jgi:hypothetical protein
MSSTICGKCNVSWHGERSHGWIWVEGVGLHMWQAPTKEQIAERLRKKYNV